MSSPNSPTSRTSRPPTAAGVRALLAGLSLGAPGGPWPVVEARPGPVLVVCPDLFPYKLRREVERLVTARWTPGALSRRPVVLEEVVLAGSLGTSITRHVRDVSGLVDFEVLTVGVQGPFLQVRVRWIGGPPAVVIESLVRDVCPMVAPYLVVAAARDVSGPVAVEAVLAWLALEPHGKALRMSADDHERLRLHLGASTLPTPQQVTVRGHTLWAMAAAHLPHIDDRWVVAATLRLVTAVGSVQGVLTACDAALRSTSVTRGSGAAGRDGP